MEKAAEKSGGREEGGMRRKLTQGRKKIPMERIENTNKRLVCFSKRRMGLVKKAYELSVLCGAQVGIIVFSPAGNPYTYCHGSRSLDAVIDRLVDPSASSAEDAPRAARHTELGELLRQEEELIKARDAELRRGEELEAKMRAAGVRIDGDVRGWEIPELQATLGVLERIHAEAGVRAHQIVAQEAMMQQYKGGGGGTLLDFMGSGPKYRVDGAGSHEEVAVDTKMKMMGGGARNELFDYLGSGSFGAHGAGSHEEVAVDTKMKVMGGGSGNKLFDYLGSGSFAAHGAGSHEEVAVDTKMKLMGGGARNNLFDYLGSASFAAHGAGSHEEVVVDTKMKLMGGGARNNLFDYLGSGSFAARGGGTHPVTIDTTMMLPGSLFHYNASGSAHGTVGGQDVTVGTKMVLMDGNVGRALAPMMPPLLPPLPLPFNHGYGYNNLSAGYGYNNLSPGYGYNQEGDHHDDHGHGAFYKYGTARNFFR